MHFLADLPVLLYRRIGKRAEAMCQDVSPAQARENFEPTRWRVVEMRHDRKPGLFCDLECNVERCHPRGTAGVPPHAHLDAGNQIAVALNDANAFARIEEPQIGAFADRHGGADSEDSGKGDVEVGMIRSGDGSITWRRN